MKTMLYAVMLAAATAPAFSAASGIALEASHDPLTRQIMSKSRQPGGGLTSVASVRGADGRLMAIPLGAVEGSLSGAEASGEASQAALRGLRAERGLTAAPRGGRPASAKTRVSKAQPQLEHVEKKAPSWGASR